jgi:hypothetical protein
MSALTELLDYEQEIVTNATPMIEISRQYDRDGDFEWFGLLNHTGQLGNGSFAPVPIYDIEISFKSSSPITSAKSLQSGKNIPFETKGKQVSLSLSELSEYDIILVEH